MKFSKIIVRNTQFIYKYCIDLDIVLEELLNIYIEIKQNITLEYKDLFQSLSIQDKVSCQDFEIFARYLDPVKHK